MPEVKKVILLRLGLYASKQPGGGIQCYGVIQDEEDNKEIRRFLEEQTGLRNHPSLRVVL
uniref:Uncharacterized protein n=1 Tax=viral metagenome TaxID=1070528 RepID=A0A6M3MCQ8_9ZZZZ